MKPLITIGSLPSNTKRNWTIPSHTLLPKYRNYIQETKTYFPRRKQRMTTTNTPRKRSLTILRLHLPTHWTKYTLRIIQLHTYVVRRSGNPIPDHSSSIYKICSTVGTNIILRCNCNYKSSVSNPIRRKGNCSMSMRRFRSSSATLTRFFALHFLIPFVIAAIVLIHLLFLHQTGSNNPLGLNKNTDKIPFQPYFTVKDVLGFAITIIILTVR